MNKMLCKIAEVKAIEVLDSRGNPTVRAKVMLSDGKSGEATVPSGASTGKYEAYEKRDGDDVRYGGKGVLGAVDAVNSTIAKRIVGTELTSQYKLDSILFELDGTENKSNLGANAILAVSVAYARACAQHYGLQLCEYLGGVLGKRNKMPCPMMNVLNGGAHSKNNIDVQEFMIVPVGIDGYKERIRASAEVYKALGKRLSAIGHITSVGDEGGYAPFLERDEDAIEIILDAIDIAGYPGEIKIALDAAASEWTDGKSGIYSLPKRKKEYSSEGLITHWKELLNKYPIISLEDGLGEEDVDGWVKLTQEIGDRIMLVGDDLFVTNKKRVSEGVKRQFANSLLIKPNQAGTVTETLEASLTAKNAGYRLIVSHRSGDTCDAFISDLGVALGADFIKAGAPCRAERTEKYNRLLEIVSGW